MAVYVMYIWWTWYTQRVLKNADTKLVVLVHIRSSNRQICLATGNEGWRASGCVLRLVLLNGQDPSIAVQTPAGQRLG